ncbi:uveal autoantigen with coiled-coil domains and ankyrin repeats isoform X2 [Trichosurus vulpecula]|uniref:uveal autoantigen with coiled-coil domains and ankyrin repeats isoform X2 n=1 Tax=Trichosurus vulpecula TaxID=9337 RepID=UPI00186B2500|nr:uveal autoantigen with coiled-coil domains and ankyrin repeats isoform X2 [Trichosurus vulpecula]
MMSCWFFCSAKNRQATDWNKYDERLMKAAERGDVEKVSSILAKKGINPGKLDVEGRSAFHVVASKGNLECLNAILVHGVDIIASDSAGRNALHLAAKYGHALCLQKLLQYNCPTEHADLQGRTALHDAAMADCTSSIQLLCDHGASVNAKDADGRTPLILATQMCRPAICQLLIDRGADVNARDKQNRTALMLGCEYGCKDAVEVLIKNGADVSLLDALGHDSSYYARIGDNLDILTLMKTAVENSNKGREPSKKGQSFQQVSYVPLKRNLLHMQDEANIKSYQREQKNVQVMLQETGTLKEMDLEAENEDLKEKLRNIQQEQRILVDKVNGLQLQLNEEVMVADDLENEKEKLRSLLTAKEKQHEESLRTIEALKNRFKYFESDYGGAGSHFNNRKEDMLHKQNQIFVTEPQYTSSGIPVPAHIQTRSMLRPLELSLPSQTAISENEILKKELDAMRAFCDSAKQDKIKLQNELAHKVAECKALALECERVKEDSDDQIKQLEDALKDVQKRMYDSEGKVKQMQTHFLALKEHLTNEAASGNNRLTEELREQLKEMKAKYEGASAEVGRLKNQIKQNEKLVEEFKRDEGRLVEENKRLQKEFSMSEIEREKKGRKALEMEGQLKELATKLALSIPTEKFENMKSLLSNEVNEKAKKFVEMEREYEKSQAELRQLKRELENYKAKLSQHVRPEEHEQLKDKFEQKSGEFGKKITELTLRNQTLQKELEKVGSDNKLLNQQLQNLETEMKTHYIPLKLNEEMKKSHALTVDDLNKKLMNVTQKYKEREMETEKLTVEKNNLSKNVSHLEATYIPLENHEKEIIALKSSITELKREVEELNKKCGDGKEKLHVVTSENAKLKKAINEQYVPVTTHEEIKAALSSTLDKTNRELTDVKRKLEAIKQEFIQIKDENGALKKKLEDSKNQMKAEFISIKEHEDKMNAINKNLKETQENNAEVLAKYNKGQKEISALLVEIEAQKKELDTIQECIKLKYAPIVSFEEREKTFKATVKELKDQLLAQTQRCSVGEEEARKCQQENEKLKNEILMIQKDLKNKDILIENSHELEKILNQKTEELNQQLKDLSEKYREVKSEKEKLLEENTKQTSEVLAVKAILQKQYVPLGQVEELKNSLNGTIEALKEELKDKQKHHEEAQWAVTEWQQMLENQKHSSMSLVEHAQIKEALEKEVGHVKARLSEKEEESQAKTEKISKLQDEIQNLKQAFKKLESREVIDLSEYNTMKNALEAQITNMTENMTTLNKKYKEVCEEAVRAKKAELSAKDEKELIQLRSLSIEQEIKDQKERCDKSLTTITDLQRRMQESARQIEAKDNKITELLNDVERLKQALNGLSQLTYTSGNSAKKENQQVETLQHQVKSLQQQLADADRQHQEVIAIYRTHLLSAAQGHMDEDVQAALLQIIRMRQGLVC